ncbi:DUF6328 family protein [Nakamurella leprariae]|uniref:Sodium:proton antiporter n=1 Tax=Nakamurella leprariae TaxID=2803911 RepID=A0A938Y8N4_9ACTN|nr:DUF6328 family protein [Nakamurella leprariae]MBM9468061.1 sodium:proton antiporter [Nakamurella leprariae]
MADDDVPFPERPVGAHSDRPETYVRNETEAVRLDRNYNELLQELRVAQTGVQILFAFLLTLPFQARFSELDPFQRTTYLLTLLTAATSVVFFIAPVTAHRRMFRRNIKDELVKLTARAASIGLCTLALSILGAALLIIDLVVGRSWAIGLVSAGLVAIVTVWVLWPNEVTRRAR